MKKSDIYKYVLAATVKDLVANKAVVPENKTDVYEVLHEICEKIELELYKEEQEAKKNVGTTESI